MSLSTFLTDVNYLVGLVCVGEEKWNLSLACFPLKIILCVKCSFMAKLNLIIIVYVHEQLLCCLICIKSKPPFKEAFHFNKNVAYMWRNLY